MTRTSQWQATRENRALRRAEAAGRLEYVTTQTLELALAAAVYRAEMAEDAHPAHRLAAEAGRDRIAAELETRNDTTTEGDATQ